MSTADIAKQTETVYSQYKRIKELVDLGYFLENYVVSGGETTKDITNNNRVNVTEMVVCLDNIVEQIEAETFTTRIASTTYYLDYKTDGNYSWATTHPNESYLPIAEVTTDENKNVLTVTDRRGPVGGFQLKSGTKMDGLDIDGGNF